MMELTNYWLDHYVGASGLCSLCANTGIIDTRGMRSPDGVECGARNYCICPNGQAMRASNRSKDAALSPNQNGG